MATNSYATRISPTDLHILVNRSDYILIGQIEKVDMIDWQGQEVVDLDARTGPVMEKENERTIRFHVKIDKESILKAKDDDIPEIITVPLWKMWHSELKYNKEREGETVILLLKGNNFDPVSAPEYMKSIDERDQIEDILSDPDKYPSESDPSSTQILNGPNYFMWVILIIFIIGYSLYKYGGKKKV